jgi:stalled ribosome rescue protein Dom34
MLREGGDVLCSKKTRRNKKKQKKRKEKGAPKSYK